VDRLSGARGTAVNGSEQLSSMRESNYAARMSNPFRTAIFFLAYTVMMVAMLPDAAALASRWASPFLLHAPAAVIAAAILAHARIPPRLPEPAGWYVALAVLAAAQLARLVIASPYLAFATPALMLAAALTLLRVRPRIGDLYQGQTMPGFIAFLAFTALISMSMRPLQDLAAIGITHPALGRVPAPMSNLAAAAVLAAAFVLLSGIRHRSMQPNPAKAWLVPGIAVFLVSAAAMHSNATYEVARYGLLAAHLMLFVGATYLLGHLLPSRPSDHMA
jgi:hypothetical protein